ncbi:hypothetical protein AC249_AIPGENE16375 [Exaiptasia diaphana]|nr:hypothetical protein AC249_AIPGENE16375 [Exaiptasia diaphana]
MEDLQEIFCVLFLCLHLVSGEDSETQVGTPKLALTIGISGTLLVLFIGLAVFVYKPNKRSRQNRNEESSSNVPI